ncbi:MAG: DUF1254 domain-containing protein [Tannerella sp.]|jgi:hypothetical protein|nr:DUF1254 domain-containing protein [Tannerella sp.]
MRNILSLSVVALLTISLAGCGENKEKTVSTDDKNIIKTSVGDFKMNGEMPAKESLEKIYRQLDLQQATQAYFWALPFVSYAQYQYVTANTFKATPSDLVMFLSLEDRYGILTANATTPYIYTFWDMVKTGPIVIDMPAGHVAGGLTDLWQRNIISVGELSPDKGLGAKYLVIPPGSDIKAKSGYNIINTDVTNVFFGIRLLDPDINKGMELLRKLKVYPYSQAANPPETRILRPEGKRANAWQPSGMAYWERLHAAIQDETVAERDRFYYAMLRNAGIEKGKPFAPTEYQKSILEEAAILGELMAKANSFDRRFEGIKQWPDRKWEHAIAMHNSAQRAENYDELNERAAWFYEAITFSDAMISKTPGQGQAYLGSYTDVSGAWLDGGKNYTLHVAANPPAANFWSFTVYDCTTRCLIENDQKRTDLSARTEGLVKNADGSYDLYFGPKAPAGKDSNWVQTLPRKHWFAYFRLYGPTEPYFDKSWKMDDITETK